MHKRASLYGILSLDIRGCKIKIFFFIIFVDFVYVKLEIIVKHKSIRNIDSFLHF